MIERTANSSTTSTACAGPAPPKAMTLNSAGSTPRSTVTSRTGLAADAEAVDDPRLAAAHQPGLGGGAAHVEADDILDAIERAGPRRADHPGGGPRFDALDRLGGDAGGGHYSAVRLHDLERRGDAHFPQRTPQPLEIAGHQRADRGGHDRRRRAGVFAGMRPEFRRQ